MQIVSALFHQLATDQIIMDEIKVFAIIGLLLDLLGRIPLIILTRC